MKDKSFEKVTLQEFAKNKKDALKKCVDEFRKRKIINTMNDKTQKATCLYVITQVKADGYLPALYFEAFKEICQK